MTKYIDKLAKLVKDNGIDTNFYNRYHVYRGLRDPITNAGVLVGLTKISSVVGSVVKDEERTAVKGELKYRGIDINDIVGKFNSKNKFGLERTAFLLLFGRMPSEKEEQEFLEYLRKKKKVPKEFVQNIFLKKVSPSIMNKLARSVLVLYSNEKDPDDLSIEGNIWKSLWLIVNFPAFVAYTYVAFAHQKKNESLFLHHMNPDLSVAEQFLSLIRENSKYTKLEAEILDVCLMLHAEHGGGNNSSFTVHVTTSSGTDIYSSIAAAIGSLKGPLHGGANIAVVHMMEDIKKNIPRNKWADKKAVLDYLKKILKKEAGDGSGLIYGMGHAVYTLSDPRAVILEKYASKLAKEKKLEDEFNLHLMIKELAPIAFKMVTGKDKIISPNVDFYSGFVYKALDLPEEVFTPLFAMGRITGWCAHRIEELINGKRIIRPAYKYVKD